MIREKLKQWISAVYGVRATEVIGQQDAEREIGFDLTSAPINIRYQANGIMYFEFTCKLVLRDPEMVDSIGFLSRPFVDGDLLTVSGCKVQNDENYEQVEQQTKTHCVISKYVTVNIESEINPVSEPLKRIN